MVVKIHWKQQDMDVIFFMDLIFHNFKEIYKFLKKKLSSQKINNEKK